MSASLEDEKGGDERQENMTVPTKSDAGDHEALAHHATYLEDGGADLTPEHREYLLKRHGTLSLDPLPSVDPADPYNWPNWKVRTHRIPRRGQRLTSIQEKRQFGARRIPRHDDHIHCSRDHSGLRRHCRGPWLLAATRLILDLDANRSSWLRTIILEAHLISVWATPGVADIDYWRCRLQHRMRRQSQLCGHVGMPLSRLFFHQPGHGYR